MLGRKQRSSAQPTARQRGLTADVSPAQKSYTQKEYLPNEVKRLDELTKQYGSDWLTIERRYNEEFASQDQLRTQEGLKNKYIRKNKGTRKRKRKRKRTNVKNGKKGEESVGESVQEENSHPTGPRDFMTEGADAGNIASLYGYQSLPASQMYPLAYPFTYADDFSFGSVDMMTQMPVQCTKQWLDEVSAVWIAGNSGSSLYDPLLTADAFAQFYELGGGLTTYCDLPVMHCGEHYAEHHGGHYREETWSWDMPLFP